MQAENALITKDHSVDYTFVEWVEHWIEMTSLSKEETTAAQYRHCLDRYIRSYFQNTSMQNVDENILQDFYDKLGPGGKQLSTQTIHMVKCVLHQALTFAVNNRLLLYNPADLVYTLNRSYNRCELLQEGLFNAILEKRFHHSYENFYPLLLLTTMRYGECAGLTWDAMDFESRTLRIRQQLVEFSRNGHTVRSIKPYSKNHKTRVILLPETACQFLKDQKELQNQYRLKTVWDSPYNLVFTDPDGSMLKHYKVTRRFKSLAASYGMPNATIHTLRHTGCSILYHITNDISLLREYAGHSSDGAANYYIHSLEMLKGVASL